MGTKLVHGTFLQPRGLLPTSVALLVEDDPFMFDEVLEMVGSTQRQGYK